MRSTVESRHPETTAAVGRAIAALLEPGDVIVLTGALGAGKTRLVQGIARGLDIPTRVLSPTFVLVRRHAGRLPLVHVDAYRLAGASDLGTLDDDVLAHDVVTCIEWGERVAEALPEERLTLDFAIGGEDGDAPRTLTVTSRGERWVARAPVLLAALAELEASP